MGGMDAPPPKSKPPMSQRSVGFWFIVVGIILLLVGASAESEAAQVPITIVARMTFLVGAYLVFLSRKKKSS